MSKTKSTKTSLQDRLEIHLRREPFRPFGLSLDSGEEIFFEQANELGAPTKSDVIFYFAPQGGVLEIDRQAIRTIRDLPKENGES